MKYSEFERIISKKRMARYLLACHNDTKKAMTLYRYNLQLSQEMFTIISCFEVALRNAVDSHLNQQLGNEWLRNSIQKGGVFTVPQLSKTCDIIYHAYKKLCAEGTYSHTKLLAEMEFGVWKYMFSPIQYRVTGRQLLRIFPNKQKSSASIQYNQSYIFNELDKINMLRNRIAHHEPICFQTGLAVIHTDYVKTEYHKIQTLFTWMGVDAKSMYYGLDHVLKVCDKIDSL